MNKKINHVVSFSGGRTSAYLVYLMEQRRLNENINIEYIFMDTGAEHPKTYNFINDLCEKWGIDLTCLRVVYNQKLGKGNDYKILSYKDITNDLKPWEGMVIKYGNPSAVSPYCTSRMKTEIHEKYCNKKYGKNNYIAWIGIRCDEQRRLKDRELVKYLADISDFEKEDVLDWWKTQAFDLGINEHLGNCVFCIKKSLGKIALAARDEPELARQFIEMTEGDHVRTSGRKHQHKRMYRKSLHLSDIIKMYEDFNRNEIANKLRNSHQYDSGSCSESCEVFELTMS